MLLDVVMVGMLVAGFGILRWFVNWNEKQINRK